MTVAETSCEAYRDHRDSGDLGNQARFIVGFLAAVGSLSPDWSRGEIAHATGLRLSSVCARVNELLKSGRLVSVGSRPCRMTGRRVETLRLPGSGGPAC